jgi:hypothetical protein
MGRLQHPTSALRGCTAWEAGHSSTGGGLPPSTSHLQVGAHGPCQLLQLDLTTQGSSSSRCHCSSRSCHKDNCSLPACHCAGPQPEHPNELCTALATAAATPLAMQSTRAAAAAARRDHQQPRHPVTHPRLTCTTWPMSHMLYNNTGLSGTGDAPSRQRRRTPERAPVSTYSHCCTHHRHSACSAEGAPQSTTPAAHQDIQPPPHTSSSMPRPSTSWAAGRCRQLNATCFFRSGTPCVLTSKRLLMGRLRGSCSLPHMQPTHAQCAPSCAADTPGAAAWLSTGTGLVKMSPRFGRPGMWRKDRWRCKPRNTPHTHHTAQWQSWLAPMAGWS